jgi:hypothetical protein
MSLVNQHEGLVSHAAGLELQHLYRAFKTILGALFRGELGPLMG